jgi:AraC-like DNA-binding protein
MANQAAAIPSTTLKAERYLPSDGLKPFVRAFMLIESADGTVNHILPDTSLTLAFRTAGTVAAVEDDARVLLPAAVLTGLRKTSRRLAYAKHSATLVVQFNETGAASFFREPLHELFNASVSLDSLIPWRKLDEVEDRLAAATGNAARVAVVERFLLARLREPEPDRLIREAVQAIHSAHGDLRVKDLVADLPISQDAFEKRFNRVIGTSPKQFAKIVRLRNLIRQVPQRNSLTDAALTAGYFDQAHFIKDFKAFTGKTPHAFFQSPVFW